VVSLDQQRAFGTQPTARVDEALAGAHLALILNNHAAFRMMPIEALADGMAVPGIIYDLWNNFPAAGLILPRGRRYVCLGSHGLARAEPLP
jgi:UDP-N-acetyl-D-mannosaminuronic acid dehydrogenase